jgi:hypothetical protein
LDGIVEGNRFATRGFRTRTGGPFYSYKTMTFPRMQISTWPYDNRIALNRADGNFTVLGKARFLNAFLYVLNIPENADDLIHLPMTILDCLRQTFFPGFDTYLEGPSRVGLFCYQDGTRVLYNLSYRSADVVLVVKTSGNGEGVAWTDLLTGRKLRAEAGKDEVRIRMSLKPWALAVVRRD